MHNVQKREAEQETNKHDLLKGMSTDPVRTTNNVNDSSGPTPQLQTEKSEANLPKYCNYNRFLLVEELALEENLRELHYGKCSLIGKLRQEVSGDFVLENIELPRFPSEFSLPEGTVCIRLLTFHYRGSTPLQNGRFCEISGEVVLIDTLNPAANHTPLTTRGLREQLSQLDNDQLRKECHAKLLQSHKPAVRLVNLAEIDRAGELAERNLEIRMLSERNVK